MIPVPRYSKEEVVRRGKELYERQLRRLVEPGNEGKVLVIDIETGEYEVSDDELEPARRLLNRRPGATLYGMRIGYPALAKIGGSWRMRLPT